MINRRVDVGVAQERRNITPEAAAPFSLGALRVRATSLVNGGSVDQWVENLGRARDHENVVIVTAKMVTVLLKQQPHAPITRRDANPHATTRDQRWQHRAIGLNVRLSGTLVTPERDLVADHREQGHAARDPEAVRHNADRNVAMQHDLVAADALDLTGQERRRLQETTDVIEDGARLLARGCDHCDGTDLTRR